jgi:hypothetical protein
MLRMGLCPLHFMMNVASLGGAYGAGAYSIHGVVVEGASEVPCAMPSGGREAKTSFPN